MEDNPRSLLADNDSGEAMTTSDVQREMESFVRDSFTRKTQRHLKAISPFLRSIIYCPRCPRRPECTSTCLAVELLLYAELQTSTSISLDKHHFHSDRILKRFHATQAESPSRHLAGRIKRSEDIDQDIIEALIDGKVPLEEIASENCVESEYVQRLVQVVKDIIGHGRQWQRIARAIIDERLPTSTAAKMYGKKNTYISKTKRKAREKVTKIWDRTGRNGSFGSLFPRVEGGQDDN